MATSKKRGSGWSLKTLSRIQTAGILIAVCGMIASLAIGVALFITFNNSDPLGRISAIWPIFFGFIAMTLIGWGSALWAGGKEVAERDFQDQGDKR